MFWAKPWGNWALHYLQDWKIHHTWEKNWARNGEIHMDGWQFSDNTRGYIIKSSKLRDESNVSVVTNLKKGKKISIYK